MGDRAASSRECPGRACFELLGKKWTALIVWALRDGPLRFSELQDGVAGVSPRMLSRRLDELSSLGIVTRHQFGEIPPRVEYSLTDMGRDLRPVIEKMELWSSRWQPPAMATSEPGESAGR
jgi:DNA-binding HxlR family transcriptional regulator